jgi:hypothetical protein
MRWAKLVERMGDREGAYNFLMRKLQRKRPTGNPSSRWEDNIKIDF